MIHKGKWLLKGGTIYWNYGMRAIFICLFQVKSGKYLYYFIFFKLQICSYHFWNKEKVKLNGEIQYTFWATSINAAILAKLTELVHVVSTCDTYPMVVTRSKRLILDVLMVLSMLLFVPINHHWKSNRSCIKFHAYLSLNYWLFQEVRDWLSMFGSKGKPYKGQDYKKLRAECIKNGTLFVDTEFPPNSKSLSYSGQAPSGVEWKRPGVNN